MAEYKRLQEYAYDYLKEMILSEELSPDEIYSETKIAEKIEMSRTPIRDALQRLSQENYIEILPSRGFRIRVLTAKDIIETFQMRTALEGYCANLIASKQNTPQGKEILTILKKNIDTQKEIWLMHGSINEFVEVDNQFHISLVGFADNRIFNEIFHNHMHRIKNLARHSLSHDNRMENTIQEHMEMWEAMHAGDFVRTQKATIRHMESPKYINLDEFSCLEK